MLSGEGNAREQWITTTCLISKKAILQMQHTFWYISLPLFCTTTTWNFQKLLSWTFYGGNVIRILIHFFFSLPLIFTLHWWPLAFLIFSPPLKNCHVVLPTKKMSPLLFISCSRSLSPFFSLSFPGCHLLSLFLCLSFALFSKFVDMTINLSLILQTTRIKK